MTADSEVTTNMAEGEVIASTAEEETEAPRPLESLLLSVAHFWSLRETANRQVDLLERHFRQDEMLAALRELNELVGLPAPKKRNPGGVRTATKAQAEDVVAVIKKLGDAEKLPRFNVQSDDLPRVLPLLGAVSVGDEQGVSARLEALETAQRTGMDEMRRLVASIARSSAQTKTVPDIVVTNPTFADVVGAPQAHQTNQFLPRQGRQDGGLLPGARPGAKARPDRSTSNKRRREGEGEGEWQEVHNNRGRKPRPRAKVVEGTAVLAEFDDLAGPEQFWIGNTRPTTDSEKVKEVLKKCADNLSVKDFKVDNVHSLTKEQDPWSRSWKVSVPAQFKELMSNPAMYPRGWSHRPFTQGPRRQERGPVLEDQRRGPGAPEAQRSGPGISEDLRSGPIVPEAQRSGLQVPAAESGPRIQEAGVASV